MLNGVLAGLTNLVLLTAFPDNERVTASLQVPFRLRELHLYNRLCDASLIDVLFSASTSTLATLDLSLNEFAPGYPGVVRSFPLVAPSLHHLSINHRASPELIAHLHLCNQLSVLDCHSSVELAKVLDTLPHPLAVLGLQLDYNLIEMVAIICPRLTQPSLAGLRRLRIPGASWSLVAASQLMSDCAQRGVVLEGGSAFSRFEGGGLMRFSTPSYLIGCPTFHPARVYLGTCILGGDIARSLPFVRNRVATNKREQTYSKPTTILLCKLLGATTARCRSCFPLPRYCDCARLQCLSSVVTLNACNRTGISL